MINPWVSLSFRVRGYFLAARSRIRRITSALPIRTKSSNGSPAGQPSTTTPIPGPCDSPQVEMRNILPNSEPLMLVESPFICFLISVATVRPVLLSGRRTAWWQNCYGVYYIGRRGFLTSIRSTFIIFQRLF